MTNQTLRALDIAIAAAARHQRRGTLTPDLQHKILDRLEIQLRTPQNLITDQAA